MEASFLGSYFYHLSLKDHLASICGKLFGKDDVGVVRKILFLVCVICVIVIEQVIAFINGL